MKQDKTRETDERADAPGCGEGDRRTGRCDSIRKWRQNDEQMRLDGARETDGQADASGRGEETDGRADAPGRGEGR